ncbi:MAG: hypothetical protein H6654_01280 [Ardenticatenaceae bacterium]|nr:hypothetical protein [Anaerolineales bacterium]MCB8940815.1 hypothetical protein [Ardenticatenaceae bacterium]MCB8972154.1 hypothetical protein [Ardenticatenaceae bacterium]
MPEKLNQLLKNPKRVLMGIIVISVLLRVFTGIVFYGNQIQSLPGTFDEVSYHNLALRVMDGHGFSFGERWWPGTAANEPTAHWSYLYTGFLIVIYSIFGPAPLLARILQGIVVGIVMPWLLYRLAFRIFAPQTRGESMFVYQPAVARAQQIALLAAAIGAVYIYFFYYTAALITEGFYISGILWVFDTAVSITQTAQVKTKQWAVLGLALGITILLRQLFLLFMPFLLLWLWWAKRPRLTSFVLPVALVVLMIAPWTVRNYLAFDQIVPLNTNSGFAFFWGNHPRYGTQFIPILPSGEYYRMIPEELQAQGLNEAQMDSALLSEALKIIAADPGRYALLSLSRISSYFMFWPSGDSGMVSNLSRVGSFGIFLPFMVYGLFLTLRRSFASWGERLASPLTLLYLFMLVYTGIHLLTWTLIRYRIPVDAILVIFASYGLLDLVERVWARRRSAGVTAVS